MLKNNSLLHSKSAVRCFRPAFLPAPTVCSSTVEVVKCELLYVTSVCYINELFWLMIY